MATGVPPGEGFDALQSYGWSPSLAAELASAPRGRPGRVTTVTRVNCEAATAAGPVTATSDPLPAVGDWVVLDDANDIVATLPRSAALTRQRTGDDARLQVLAANVDLVLLTHPLDRPLNLNRVERELVVAWESGAAPLVLLTKADTADPEVVAATVEAIRRRDARVEVLVVSTRTGAGVEELVSRLRPNRTAVLLGSSGAGKSTLVNHLLGRAAQATATVRSADRKGRHTTSTRNLLLVPGGGVLIDTPGLRSVSLWTGVEGLTEAFADIDELALECRFRDCTHGVEPGCAVQAAIAAGQLSAERLDSYRKLHHELASIDEADRQDATPRGRRRRR